MGLFFRRRYTVALPYDAEVEYLQGDGSAYIDTEFYLNWDSTIEVVCQMTDYGYNQRLFGAQVTNLRLVLFNDNTRTRSYQNAKSGGNTVLIGMRDKDVGTHTIILNENGTHSCYFDGTNRHRFVTASTAAANCYLFWANGTAATAKSTCKIYSCKLYDRGVLSIDLIPVRIGIVGYMFDKVSGRLFGNNGTGDFVVGPDINQWGGVVTQYKSSIYVALGEERRAA